MIAHLVLFKLKPGMSKMDPRVEAVIANMDALPQYVSVIRAWEHGLNQTHDALAYDYGLRALFDNEDDLHAYFDHSQHLTVLRQWEVISDLVFCDYLI